MATLSMFYGIIVFMFFRDNRQHKLPHVHVRYQLVQAWITLHADELMANWELAVDGKNVYQIEPLK
jgi:hypothetical protein